MTNSYLQQLFSLKGKIIVVTGAAGQLGGIYVRSLLNAGAKVAGIDFNLKNPKGKLGTVRSRNFIKFHADVTDKASVKAALKSITARFGCPHVLINNAALDAPPGRGGEHSDAFENYSEEAWDSVMDVGLKGAFLCSQVIGGAMAAKKRGTIINISSIYGILAPDQSIYAAMPGKRKFYKPVAYSVSKAGVLNLTRYLAVYWADRGIRVNTLTLGGVFNRQHKSFLKRYEAKVPLGRMANADEYNGAMVFLCSDACTYMTGANIVIDGGYSAW